MDQTTPHVARSASLAIGWLRRQLAWEQTLAELRDPDIVERDDEAAA